MLKRLVGVLLALAGLVPLGLGAWFAAKLGPSGTATFTIDGAGSTPILLTPRVLNRTDLPVQIKLNGADGYVTVGTPSDTAAALGKAQRTEVTGITVRDWRATTRTTGSGAPKDLRELDLWREVTPIDKATAIKVTQQTAPESVLIVPKGKLESATLSWSYDTWFYQALVLAAAGALLTTVGLLLARPNRRAAQPAVAEHVAAPPVTTTEPTTTMPTTTEPTTGGATRTARSDNPGADTPESGSPESESPHTGGATRDTDTDGATGAAEVETR